MNAIILCYLLVEAAVVVVLLLDAVVVVDPLDDPDPFDPLGAAVVLHRFLLQRFLLQLFLDELFLHLDELFLHLDELFLHLLHFDELLLLLLETTYRRFEPELDRRRFLASGRASGAEMGSG